MTDHALTEPHDTDAADATPGEREPEEPTRRSRGRPIVLPVLLIGVLALLAALVAWGLVNGTGAATTETISFDGGGVEQAEIQLSSGVGGLELEAADGAELLAGTVSVPAGHELVSDRRDAGGVAEVALSIEGGRWFGFLTRDEAPAWDLQMAGDVPVDLALDTGVGESVLDLRDADLRDLTVDAGVGSTTITLPEVGDVSANIDGGVGEINVRIPTTMAVRVLADAGVGDVEIDGPWQRDGARWVSDGWDGATNRVDVIVNTGVGEVRIEQID